MGQERLAGTLALHVSNGSRGRSPSMCRERRASALHREICILQDTREIGEWGGPSHAWFLFRHPHFEIPDCKAEALRSRLIPHP